MQAAQSVLSAAGITLSKPAIVELAPYLQPFPYGREGRASMAARIAQEALPGTVINPSQPYGEIWLGSTHNNGPCTIHSGLNTGKKLKDLIASDPSFYLGQSLLDDKRMQELYENDLPFLFKILSFDKPLPLQAHPDPSLGAKLKKQEKQEQGKNEDFVDENGKPEVSVALSDFKAFVGFRPPSHVAAFIEAVLDFSNLFTESQRNMVKKAGDAPDDPSAKEALKSFFGTLLNLPEDKSKEFIKTITTKLDCNGASSVFGANGDAEALAKIWKKNLTLFEYHDVGIIITSYLMNLLQLSPGQGCWILADDIHAYVEGDVIECMANSDNMVCHGLGDTEQGGKQTFVDMLSYRHLPGDKLLLEFEEGWSKGTEGRSRLYKVPIQEFDIVQTVLDSSHTKESLTLPGSHTFVVTQGTFKARVGEEELVLKQGHTAFVKAEAKLELEWVEGEKAELWGSFYQ